LNRWSLLRSNLVTALQALPALAGVTVEEIVQPAGVNAIAPPAIGVCRPGGRATSPPEVGYHLLQESQTTFQLAIRTDSATDTIASAKEAEQIATDAMAVRQVDIGIYNSGDTLNTGGVFMDYVADAFVTFPGREPGGAGPIVFVVTLKTTDFPV
jgi:hypothetical protein